MKIEILYSDLCCLYGDKGNTKFLAQCMPKAEFIYTALNDKPAFLNGDVDLCCMYSMSEQSQEKILDRLMPYKAEITAACADGKTLFLLLGNAMELFGQYIQREDSSKVAALGVFNTYTVRHAPNRFNTLIQATFENMTLLGYTSRFADTFGITEDNAFCRVEIGSGSDPKTKLEGIRSGRVIASYLLGPLLVANPDFSKWLLQQLGVDNPALPFEDALYLAYETKRKEFQRTDLELD